MLKRLVRSTAFYPGLSHLYRLYYAIAIRALLSFMRRVPEVACVRTHRGFGVGDWVAGFSDIDLLIIIDAIDPAGEVRLLKKLWHDIFLLRAVFPFIGTVHIVTVGELTCWQRHGGIRRREQETLKTLYAR